MSEMQVVLGFDMETDIGSWTPFYEGFSTALPSYSISWSATTPPPPSSSPATV